MTKPSARIGGSVGINISSRGIRPSIRRSRKGCAGLLLLPIIVIVLVIELAACAPSAEQIRATVSAAITALPSLTPWPTYTLAPTYTLPPTQTPNIIIVTATVTPTLEFETWIADQAVRAFQAVGLEVDSPMKMTKEDYGLAPMAAKEGIHFLIPSLCSTCGGRILSFDNQTGLDVTRTYYVSLGQQSAVFFSWVFVRDNILVQINGDLPEEQARKYGQALESIGK